MEAASYTSPMARGRSTCILDTGRRTVTSPCASTESHNNHLPFIHPPSQAPKRARPTIRWPSPSAAVYAQTFR
ncbi:hypothetical protein I306_01326 [Cryptococcus gattii EJB2]|uniref:Uncharacterized protein n=1 Tax=Cryptococcus gattii EJB2 TaxID=1296103 RepID=A0ABR5C174_9TREE|nr:hypothetical protein I306_01326 [Cryptococcus gattii EJB2]